MRKRPIQRGVAKHLFPTVDDMKFVSAVGTEGFVRRATTEEAKRQRKAEDKAAELRRKILEREVAVVTKRGEPGYRGEYSCSDCCSMSHCEKHHKEEGTYPFEEAEPDGSLERAKTSPLRLGHRSEPY